MSIQEDDGSPAGAGPLPPWEADSAAVTIISDREARASIGQFDIYADRKQTPFISLRSGLSHKGGHVQHILSVDDARRLGLALLDAAQFASQPTFADRIAAAKAAKGAAPAREPKS